MKKRNHPANVVDVSSRIMGLLGRRKVDPTTDAMKAFKPGFDVSVLTAGIEQPSPDVVLTMQAPGQPSHRLPLHLQQSGRFMRPTESPSLGEYAQFCGRIERKPGLTPDEQKRLIDVLERHLA